jgi:hypothetical protein
MTAAHRVGRVATATLVAVLLPGVSAGPTTASETTVAKIDEEASVGGGWTIEGRQCRWSLS